MKHNVAICVSNGSNTDGIMACRKVAIRERFMRLLFGKTCNLTILVPGASVDSIAISEKGGVGT